MGDDLEPQTQALRWWIDTDEAPTDEPVFRLNPIQQRSRDATEDLLVVFEDPGPGSDDR